MGIEINVEFFFRLTTFPYRHKQEKREGRREEGEKFTKNGLIFSE
jgi:hypothetical protein